jgi:hypothetical protein
MKVFRKQGISTKKLGDRATSLSQNQSRWRELWGEARTRILV